MAAFRGHISAKIRNRLRNKNTDLVIIHSGMTSQLQPLMCQLTNHPNILSVNTYGWLNKDNHGLTPSGKTKRTSASVIVEWISKAWKEVPVNIISNPFLKCRLSNAEDGMQDDIL
jgi:hypothetical protein